MRVSISTVILVVAKALCEGFFTKGEHDCGPLSCIRCGEVPEHAEETEDGGDHK
jgi:hypothetical protein